MTTMLHEPGLRQQVGEREPHAWPLQTPPPTAARTPGNALLDKLRWVGEKVLGLLLGIVIVVVQFVLYAVAVLAMPLAPFLLPLFMLPVVLMFGLLILGVGTVLAALGWL